MKLAISGTYSAGKTTMSIALSHLTGIPRTHAKTMREILPVAVPGKRLEDCTAPELVQLIIRRYEERVVHESHLPGGFVSDGSSIHEWVYGKVRVMVGTTHPDDSVEVREPSPELLFFEEVMDNVGMVAKQHAKQSYDVFIHLPIEFPLVRDGHRPVSERFRHLCDQLLIDTLQEYSIPYHIVGGSIRERLDRILGIFGLTPVIPMDEAIARTELEMAVLADAIRMVRPSADVAG